MKVKSHCRVQRREEEVSIFPGMNRISCECGLVYISKTGRNLSSYSSKKAKLKKSPVAKHSWTSDHHIKWNEVTTLA